MPDDEQLDRRRFFRTALGEMFRPLAKAVAPIERAAQHLGSLQKGPIAPSSAGGPVKQIAHRASSARSVIRPPGALPEQEFKDVCSRCGDCVAACPVSAIKMEPGGRGEGLPFVDPAESPCVLCDGLLCMHRCPSGALVPTSLADIDMGTAGWREPKCLRSLDQECTICIDRCPVGSSAIELRDGRVHVMETGCTGCGVCEHHCPAQPKAIVVVPAAARTP